NENNHVLLVVLAKLATSVFPVSEFTVRVPTVAGALIFPLYVARLLERMVDRPWIRLAGFGAIVLNPYVLDFMSAARGYGLMLALIVVALNALMPDRKPLTTARALAGGAPLGPAVTANRIAMGPVAAAAAGWRAARGARRSWSTRCPAPAIRSA